MPGVQEGLGLTAEKIGAYWSHNRGQGVQLEVVAAKPREKKLFIGEAKWGTDALCANMEHCHRFDQAQSANAAGRARLKCRCGLFACVDFTEATKHTAHKLGVRLVNLMIRIGLDSRRQVSSIGFGVDVRVLE